MQKFKWTCVVVKKKKMLQWKRHQICVNPVNLGFIDLQLTTDLMVNKREINW